MSFKLATLFAAVMQTEEDILPIFITNPQSQKIAGAVLVAESIFGAVFGLTTPAPAPVTASVSAAVAPPTPVPVVLKVAPKPAPVVVMESTADTLVNETEAVTNKPAPDPMAGTPSTVDPKTGIVS